MTPHPTHIEAVADAAASSMSGGIVNAEAIDREAIRLANIGRRCPRLILLGTLNPDSQTHYRELAKRNLEDK